MKNGNNKKLDSETYRIGIKGLVQGVGFRPFVFRMAKFHGLTGWVENRNDGVVLEVNGTESQLSDFRKGVFAQAPAAASIESIEIRKVAYESFESFDIKESSNISNSITEISPDTETITL